MIAIMMIFSATRVHDVAEVLRRENEYEMIFRAQEIVRGIFRFQSANGRLPNKLEELLEPGPKGEYFLRRLYDDPLVPDGKWGLLYAGPGGQIVDPSSPQTGYGEELGNVSSAPTQTVGGLQGGFAEGGPREIAGLPIAGVKSLCKDEPFQVYRGIRDYSQWQFSIYDLQNIQAPGQSGGGTGQGTRPGTRPGGRNPQQPQGGRRLSGGFGRGGGGGN